MFSYDFTKKLSVKYLANTKYQKAEHGIMMLEIPTGKHPSTTLRENLLEERKKRWSVCEKY